MAQTLRFAGWASLSKGPDVGECSSSDRPPDLSSSKRLGGIDPWGKGGERGWAWWDTGQDNSSAGWVEIEVDGHPYPNGALRWLLRACGAVAVD